MNENPILNQLEIVIRKNITNRSEQAAMIAFLKQAGELPNIATLIWLEIEAAAELSTESHEDPPISRLHRRNGNRHPKDRSQYSED